MPRHMHVHTFASGPFLAHVEIATDTALDSPHISAEWYDA